MRYELVIWYAGSLLTFSKLLGWNKINQSTSQSLVNCSWHTPLKKISTSVNLRLKIKIKPFFTEHSNSWWCTTIPNLAAKGSAIQNTRTVSVSSSSAVLISTVVVPKRWSTGEGLSSLAWVLFLMFTISPSHSVKMAAMSYEPIWTPLQVSTKMYHDLQDQQGHNVGYFAEHGNNLC